MRLSSVFGLVGIMSASSVVNHASKADAASTVQQSLARAAGSFVLLATVLVVVSVLAAWLWPDATATKAVQAALVSQDLWVFVLIGVGAQAVDGALGMAYGVTANSLLMGVGVPPASATAAVHLSEVFTTGFSGYSHWRLGNVNKGLFLRLLIPGIVGAVAGAYLVSLIDGNVLKPFVSAYLLIMGIYILRKAFVAQQAVPPTHKRITPLALIGGFVDSVGGGGWGPVVTTTLLGRGHAPKETIGSVNSAEFFLTLASATAFAALIGFGYWTAIVGLILGGLLAAPFAAWLSQHLSAKQLLVVVGLLITGLSIWNLSKALL